MTIAQPPLKPCTKRASIITAMVGLSPHTIDATTMTTRDATNGRRRPRWSEIGPPASCPSAMPTKKVVSVSWTPVALACRSCPTAGKPGTYMSVANGAIMVSRTTLTTTAVVSRPRGVTSLSGGSVALPAKQSYGGLVLVTIESSGSVFLVGHVLEPGHDLSLVIGFLDRHVSHEPVGGRSVPVVLARFDVDDVTRADLLDLTPAAGDVADPVGDVEGLSLGVVVPGSAGSRGESHVGTTDGGLLVGVADAVDVDVAREPARRTGSCLTST